MNNKAFLKSDDGPVEILAIIDRSGSMTSIAKDAIGGFNTFLKEQQDLPGEATLSLVLFDDRYEVPLTNAPIKDVAPLTDKTFVPRGMTALYDALGKAVSGLIARNPKKAIVVIITDGEENSSREFNDGAVKTLMDTVKSKGWQSVFLAANQDAFAVGRRIGTMTNADFAPTGAGVTRAYAQANSVTMSYRAGQDIPADPPKPS